MPLRIRFAVVIILILALFCIDLIATKFYLYWSYVWLDNLMHAFGGFLAGNLVLIGRQVAVHVKGMKEISRFGLFSITILGGLLIGILWETIEFLCGVSHLGPNFIMDTVIDLAMDIIGAAVAFVTWIKIPHKPYNQNYTTER